MKILVVEDEAVLREGLSDLLRGAGHAVETVADGQAALDRAGAAEHDLVLLDVMLPRMSGIDVCRELRRRRAGLPIILLTARGSEDDKVRGLEAGADDYVTKPFGARELLARVDAVARRMRAVPSPPERVEIDGCVIDLGRCRVDRDGDCRELTAKETAILRYLHRHRARAVQRAELLESVWESRSDLQTRTVDMTIANLRRKIERDAGDPRIVVTVKGVGYAWGDP